LPNCDIDQVFAFAVPQCCGGEMQIIEPSAQETLCSVQGIG
jgi:hypothetical protein